MAGGENKRVLCVDDEPNVLNALKRQLRGKYDVSVATSGADGLRVLGDDEGFAIVISDMRMPKMNGAAFLREVKKSSPDTVRILLTGQADLRDAVDVVNSGGIFRFLQKPCPNDELLNTLEMAAEQYRLITAERVLLTETLHGSIKTLSEILSMANPMAFSRSNRAKNIVSKMLKSLDVVEAWPVEVAAMLSQIGCVTLPPEVAEKLYKGAKLDPSECRMVDRMPPVVEKLVANIPRLEQVCDILRYHRKNFDGTGYPKDQIKGEKLPLGSRLLKIALDFHVLEVQGVSRDLAVGSLRSRVGQYDPDLLDVFGELYGGEMAPEEIKEIRLRDVVPGMVFADNVTTGSGVLLIPRGQEASPAMIERIRNFTERMDVKEPVRVIPPRPVPVDERADPAVSASSGEEITIK